MVEKIGLYYYYSNNKIDKLEECDLGDGYTYKFTTDSNDFIHSFNNEPGVLCFRSDFEIINKWWFKNGRLHNLNGYAFWNLYNLMGTEYWIDGKEYTKEQWEIERNRILILEECKKKK